MANAPARIPEEHIRTARELPIREVWARLNLPTLPERGNICSPWRDETSPSLQVGGEKNIVTDYGTSEAWDTINLVRKVKECDFSQAVGFILNRPVNELVGAGGNGARPPQRSKTFIKSGNKWTLEQANQKLLQGRDALLKSEAAMDLLRSYGLTHKTIETAPLAFDNDLSGRASILYTDDLKNPSTIKTKTIRRIDGKRKGQLCFRAGDPAYPIWFPFGHPEPGELIIMGGGEEKALLIGQETGMAVCCPFGGEKSGVGEEQAAQVARYEPKTLIIAFDAGESGAEKAALNCYKAGVESVYSVQWPEGTPVGYDVNDVFKDGGTDALHDLLRNSKPVKEPNAYDPENDPWELRTPETAFAPRPPIEFLIKDTTVRVIDLEFLLYA